MRGSAWCVFGGGTAEGVSGIRGACGLVESEACAGAGNAEIIVIADD